MKETMAVIDSIRNKDNDANIIIAGDFNDTADSQPMTYLENHGLVNVSKQAIGENGARGSYKYKGRWESIDHILVSESLRPNVISYRICDTPCLICKDKQYGGWKPRRSFNGYRYDPEGFSDRLPVVVKLSF